MLNANANRLVAKIVGHFYVEESQHCLNQDPSPSTKNKVWVLGMNKFGHTLIIHGKRK
jgi:hypothetical protein